MSTSDPPPRAHIALAPVPLPSGFLLPSIHSLPPFFTIQPHPSTQSHQLTLWSTLILSYARYTRTWVLRPSTALSPTDPWGVIFRNDRIHRSLSPSSLSTILASLIERGEALPESPSPSDPNSAGSVLILWRSLPDWSSYLHSQISNSGQLNTILTFYELAHPPVEGSDMDGMPEALVRRVVGVLQRAGKAQVIEGEGGGGVRFFA